MVSVCVSSFQRTAHTVESIAQKLTLGGDEGNAQRTQRKRAATLCHEGRHTFDSATLKVVPEWPLVYWWEHSFLSLYSGAPKLAEAAQVKNGLQTNDNVRYLRRPWEHSAADTGSLPTRSSECSDAVVWVPYVKGANGAKWKHSHDWCVNWGRNGLDIKILNEWIYGSASRSVRSEELYLRPGVAMTSKGTDFGARAFDRPSIFDVEGRSVFGLDSDEAVVLLNGRTARSVMSALNPTVHFTAGDALRIPVFRDPAASAVWGEICSAFGVHESHREPSIEFRRPGPSPWRHAQDWAQAAVDRPEGAPLPEYVEQLEPEPLTDHLSFALGVALGRLGPADSAAEGILDPATADLSHGILFLDTTLDAEDRRDGLGHPAAAPLHAAWAQHGPAIGTKRSLRDWLALDFFKDVHKGMYENRPIHWPLSSSGKTFVAWVNIHRMNEQTMRVLLADHLVPTLARLDGELSDLRSARDSADKKASRAAERQYDRVIKTRDELQAFIAQVEQCADRGAPPTDNKCLPREQDARYAPSLDDGVMINSAALWPLLDPQWKDPKRWWKELATAQGRKDYDWSHLAMHYWPTRVDRKGQQNPSLGVAHGCFWRYHPERAWAWELRLQDEIGPDFRIEELPYRPGGHDLGDTGDVPHRDAFLRDQSESALTAIETEAVRRMGRGKSRKGVPEMRILETGLWSAHGEALWEMELRLAEKQGAELRILAPDETEARAAFEARHPERVSTRQSFLANLVPPAELSADEDAEDKDVYGDAEESEEYDT